MLRGRDFAGSVRKHRDASDCSDGVLHVSFVLDVGVAPFDFCPCLFKDRTPHRSAALGFLCESQLGLARVFEKKLIINNYHPRFPSDIESDP